MNVVKGKKGNSVSNLLRRAMAKSLETSEICGRSPNHATDAGRAIAALANDSKVRYETLKVVYEAMNGNKAILRHWGNE